MQLNEKELLGLLVETKSGQSLGNISGFEIETDTQQIIKYFVKTNSFIKNFLVPELIVDYRQVISITKEKMVVDDNVKKETAFVKKTKIPEKEIVPLPT
jgi:sporulation protein YlmC with PRC-barrel domain